MNRSCCYNLPEPVNAIPLSACPLAIAVALALVIVLLGPISGAHVNPAVTFMMFANKELAKSDLLPYVLAQIAGGLAAIQLHKAIVN